MRTTERSVQLDSIQVLRILAALLVVLDHSLLEVMARGAVTTNTAFAFRSGGFGVHVFFAISGFVMAHSMSSSFATAGAWAAFLRRRIIRILPLYWLVTLLLVVKAALAAHPFKAADVFYSLGFIPYEQAPGVAQPINGVGWTLNYEMQFYVIFAACLFLPVRAGAAAISLLLISLVAGGTTLASAAGSHFWRTAIAFWTDPILLYFLAGVWLGFARRWAENTWKIHHVRMAAVVAVSFLTILAYEWMLYADRMSWSIEAAFVMFLLVIASMANAKADNAVDRLLKKLGDASYSTYLVHIFVVAALAKIIRPDALPLSQITWVGLAMAISAVAGWAVYLVFERPMLKFLQARIPGRR